MVMLVPVSLLKKAVVISLHPLSLIFSRHIPEILLDNVHLTLLLTILDNFIYSAQMEILSIFFFNSQQTWKLLVPYSRSNLDGSLTTAIIYFSFCDSRYFIAIVSNLEITINKWVKAYLCLHSHSPLPLNPS